MVGGQLISGASSDLANGNVSAAGSGQVWLLTQFYAADFSQSRISVKQGKKVFKTILASLLSLHSLLSLAFSCFFLLLIIFTVFFALLN